MRAIQANLSVTYLSTLTYIQAKYICNFFLILIVTTLYFTVHLTTVLANLNADQLFFSEKEREGEREREREREGEGERERETNLSLSPHRARSNRLNKQTNKQKTIQVSKYIIKRLE